MAVIELVRSTVGIPAICKNEDVGRATERVGEHGDGLQVDVRIVAGGLACGGTIKVPGGEILNTVILFLKGL